MLPMGAFQQMDREIIPTYRGKANVGSNRGMKVN